MMMLRMYNNWEQARQTVLRRRDVTVLEEVPESVRDSIQRVFGHELTPEQAVAQILADVRQRGDDALREWTARIDGLELDDFEVQAEALEAGYKALPADLARALELSAGRIRDFHTRQPIPPSFAASLPPDHSPAAPAAWKGGNARPVTVAKNLRTVRAYIIPQVRQESNPVVSRLDFSQDAATILPP